MEDNNQTTSSTIKIFENPLKETVVYVLEEWAMFLVDDLSLEDAKNMVPGDGKVYLVTINYTGVINGVLNIVCPENVSALLAQTLLCLDPDTVVEPDLKRDAVKELGNIISGNFLVNAFGEDTVFELPDIVVEKVDHDAAFESLNDKAVFCSADDELLAVSFQIHT